MVGIAQRAGRDRRGAKEGKSGAFYLISDYFKEVDLRLSNSSIVADKVVDFREFSAARARAEIGLVQPPRAGHSERPLDSRLLGAKPPDR